MFPNSEFGLNVTREGYLTDGMSTFDPQASNHVDLVKTRMEMLEFEKWRSCCDEAKKCCAQIMSKANPLLVSNVSNLSSGGPMPACNSIWDGWSCHPVTLAGKISKVKCPSHFIADTCSSVLGT